ncbi:MAG: 30S ribosomal protein S13 [Parcubacteria group bacterium CG_4_10_14_0_8_um_filter_35_7]|nr:MAG: 30S ribosomal protein S13 [Parcubacteria group bacterium CG23_combo_of_CG06-09_8_20_14_all_35_9]PIY78816.1 MAG: 30S ribosomal protein S13 [Parcubacteria group bacterium CG_4_10_14_0_8_um_filter_35_7]
MARIAGITLPQNKRVEIALTYIFGIGYSLSNEILKKAKIDHNKRTKDLSEEEINYLREIIEKNYLVEGVLRGRILSNIKRMKEIGCYKGIRHAKNLTVRGQRTKTNSRTVRGNVRRTIGSGRRSLAQKT